MIQVIIKAFRQKTKYILYSLIIGCVFAFFIMLLFINDYYTFKINDVLGSQIENRGLVVSNCDSQFLTILNDLEHIELSYPLYQSIQTIDNNNYKISINVFHDDNIIIGKKAQNQQEIIISKFYYNKLNLTEKDILSQKVIELIINNRKTPLKIVGVTNNNKENVYIQKDLFAIINNNEIYNYYVVVDEYQNVDSVIKTLQEKGYYAELYDTSKLLEINEIEKLQLVFKSILIVCGIILGITLFLILKNIMQNEEKNIAILKTIGFNDFKIGIIIFSRIILILIFSITCCFLLNFFISYFFRQYHFIRNNLFKHYIFSFTFSLILLIIQMLFYIRKLKKMDIFKALEIEIN